MIIRQEEPGYTRAVWDKPFVKWAGGKTQLLPTLLRMVPVNFKLYFEPFVGGGALFFALQPAKAMLGDVNEELINAYSIVRYALPSLVTELKQHERAYRKGGADYFYSIRERPIPAKLTTARQNILAAARFIFLNKTCYNGLYRVNKAGGFNVPHGEFKSPPNICDTEVLRAASLALKGALFLASDFERIFSIASKNDGSFIYADPPYVPVSATSNFLGYAKTGFTYEDQKRLRDAAVAARSKGVRVLLSNSSSPLVRELYGSTRDFEITEVDARRGINSDASKRGAVKELIIKTKGW